MKKAPLRFKPGDTVLCSDASIKDVPGVVYYYDEIAQLYTVEVKRDGLSFYLRFFDHELKPISYTLAEILDDLHIRTN